MRILPNLPPDLPEYLGTGQVAELFGVDRHTVRKWHLYGSFPAPVIVSPRVHLYSTRAIRRFVAEMLRKIRAEAADGPSTSGGASAPPPPFPSPDAEPTSVAG